MVTERERALVGERTPFALRFLRAFLIFGSVLILSGCSLANSLAWLMDAPTVVPSSLQARLKNAETLVLLDLRSESDFVRGHIASAEWVTPNEIVSRVTGVPRERNIVLVCEHGNLAALVAPVVRGTGHENLQVLAGGMDAWRKGGGAVTKEGNAASATSSVPQLHPTKFEAILAYGAGVVIKPTYMLMSFGIIFWLRRTELRELKRLRTGLIAFLSGESACLAGFYFDAKSVLYHRLDALHGFGMAVGITYGLWGMYEIFERRLLSMNDLSRGCALSRFCGACTRQQNKLCRPQQQLRHGLWLLLPVVALPFTYPIIVRNGTTLLFGTLVDYCWPVVNQVIELRIYPFVALILLVTAWYLLRGPRSNLEIAHRFLFLGMGLFCFSMVRFLLKNTFVEAPYWGDIWEEVTELQGISLVWFMLWCFRKQFGLSDTGPIVS